MLMPKPQKAMLRYLPPWRRATPFVIMLAGLRRCLRAVYRAINWTMPPQTENPTVPLSVQQGCALARGMSEEEEIDCIERSRFKLKCSRFARELPWAPSLIICNAGLEID